MSFYKRFNKEELAKTKAIANAICTSQNNWDDISIEFDRLFERISDREDKSYDETYSFIELIESPAKTIKNYYYDNKKWAINLVLSYYEKAPNKIVLWLNKMEPYKGKWIQNDGAIYILKTE